MRSRAHGFTLLEMMLTIGIAGVLTTLAVTTLRDTLSLKREAGAARQVAGLLKRARTIALSTHSRVRVDADTATGIVTLSSCKSTFGSSTCANGAPFTAVPSSTVQLNHDELIGVNLTAAPGSALTLAATGFPEVTGTYTYVVDEAGRPGSFSIVVSTAGEVTVQ
jgi:prepilin-type N-terminal cleavage/methylation domain-containing protein